MAGTFAHTGRDPQKSDWQPLSDHLQNVARLARTLAQPAGVEEAAYLAGLLHDLGKYAPAFQDYLDGKWPSVDHSTAGAAYLAGKLPGQSERLKVDVFVAHLISACIAGHHAGLPDFNSSENSSLSQRLERRLEPLSEDWQTELAITAGDLVPTRFKASWPEKDKLAFALSVMGRMIFSSLVDADFKDTEAFYATLEPKAIERDWPSLQSLLPELISRFETYMSGFSGVDSELNQLRCNILSHVRANANARQGLFTLTVPTGGGKTLTSLAFALDHAHIHGHRRIIYAIPFTSVIEQTARIFRDVLGEDVVLEHHSAIEDIVGDRLETGSRSEAERQRTKLRQAREDWAAPLVVTTNVQLFESLFASRTSRARKLHNIAGSVLILDEAQTLPRGLLLPAMRMLEELAERYGCTIVLCTATQPALNKELLEGGLPLRGRELAPDPQGLAKRLKRSRLVSVGNRSNDDLVSALANEPQSLIIVNSRKHALDLYRKAAETGTLGLVHLTTRMCAAHRATVLSDIRLRLKDQQDCRVIATSLVEAGVDFDFPSVWRAEAGLDSLVQAAGRCNREGKRSLDESIVKVFAAPDYPPPREIKSLIGDMSRMMAAHAEDLSSLDAIRDYFREVYWRLDAKGLDAKNILGCFPPLTRNGPDFSYRTAAERFRMIESGLAPVIIPYDKRADEAIRQLGVEAIRSGTLARILQRYVVQAPPKARAKLVANGKAVFATPELRGDQFCVLQDMGLYKRDTGLLWEDADYLSIEESLW